MIFPSVVWIFLVFICPVIVLSNALIISAWIRFKRLRTPSNFLIITLSSCDLGLGLLIPSSVAIDISSQIPEEDLKSLEGRGFQNLSIENSTDLNGEDVACEEILYCFHLLLILILSSLSLLSIGSISLDRFLSVSEPLRYNHYVTMTHVQRFSILSGLYSILVYILPISFLERVSTEILIFYSGLFLFAPSLTLAIGSYSYIYAIARSHAKQIFSVEISLHDLGVNDLSRTVVKHNSGHHRYGLTLTLLLLGLLSWAPIHLLAAMDVLGNSHYLKQVSWRLLAVLPISISILFNPWLYAYRSSEVKNGIIRILDGIISKVTGHPSSHPIFLQNKDGELSCASNVRLLAISPTETTFQGSHAASGSVANVKTTPVLSHTRKFNPNPTQDHLQLISDYQVSTL